MRHSLSNLGDLPQPHVSYRSSMAVDVPPNGGWAICNLALTQRRALAIFGWKSRLKAKPHIKDKIK